MSNQIPDKHSQEISSLHARQLIPVSGKSVSRILEAGGMDFLCREVLDGKTIKEIAEAIGVPRSDLTSWQINEDDPRYPASQRASAETCLDNAQACLETPAGAELTMADVQIRRARADLWKHRAMVRDSRYSPKGMTLDLSPAAPAAVPSFCINILPSPNREKVIEGEDNPDLI